MTTTTATADPRTGQTGPLADDADICCPLFDPTPWDGTTHVWKDRLFLQHDVHQILHVPVDMGRVITGMNRALVDAGAMPDPQDYLLLVHDSSSWKSEVLIAVTKEVPGGTMVRITGRFFTAVYEGPYREVPNWIAATDARLAARGEKAIKYYIHYAYCPKCAKKYGHNFGVTFAQLA